MQKKVVVTGRFVRGEMELEENDALWNLLKAFSRSNQKVNRDFGAQDSKIEALEVKDNDIPKLRSRNQKVNFRPEKSTEVNWTHMVNPEGITQRLMQDFSTSTRRAHLIGLSILVISRDSYSKRGIKHLMLMLYFVP